MDWFFHFVPSVVVCSGREMEAWEFLEDVNWVLVLGSML